MALRHNTSHFGIELVYAIRRENRTLFTLAMQDPAVIFI